MYLFLIYFSDIGLFPPEVLNIVHFLIDMYHCIS